MVPPMSKVIRSGKPASRPTSCAPTTPVDGPDSTVRTGNRAACSKPITPPFDCVRCGVTRQAELRQPIAQAADVGLHHRAEIGVHHRGGHPLELAEFRRHLDAIRRRRPRETPPRGCGAPFPHARFGRSRTGSRPRPPARRPRATAAPPRGTPPRRSGVSTVPSWRTRSGTSRRRSRDTSTGGLSA